MVARIPPASFSSEMRMDSPGFFFQLFPEPFVGSVQIKADPAALGEFQILADLSAEILHVFRGFPESLKLFLHLGKNLYLDLHALG